MTTPYQPGYSSARQWERDQYTNYQWGLWTALEDSYYAHVGGYAVCRMPTPGKVIDMDRFKRWQATMVKRWAYEATRDHLTRGLTAEDWPEGLWQYCYERMLEAEQLMQD